ncbi:hypothetical protein [Actinoplanes sp. N902-109]|uniref:hypothetical protein n=1 Tax=Actinoplanes sp. (strain N902-109) TaxID=649831 RepID=UPI000329590C|nr:hypothetical protein [Actinoplanes sp. N902-109]AGL18808.1 hypothetical protein L083_5298 [Actinoplanes sp. N902-109]
MTVDNDLADPDETMRIDAGDETVRIDVGDKTVRLDVGEKTVRIVPGEQTQVIETQVVETQVVETQVVETQVIEAQVVQTRVVDAGAAGETQRLPVPRQGRRRGPAGPARPAGAPPPPAAEAPQTHTVVLPRISTDPLDELVDRIRPSLLRAVDALQVAAALEADGFTDRIARVEYGFADVFALALEVYRRLGPPVEALPDQAAARSWRHGVRVLAHGPLYALPSAVFPAVLGVLGQRSVVLALTLASAFGWMYAGTAAYGAYKLLGAYRPRGAALLLRWSTLGAPVAGALCGLLVVAFAGGGWGLVLLAMCQLGYQMAGTILVFYRREGLQVATMIPAVVGGCAFLWYGSPARPVAIGTAIAGVAAAYAAALLLTHNRGDRTEPPGLPVLRTQRSGLTGVTLYGACSAALLLHAEAPYLLHRLDIAISVAPLIAAMGFVEWRAEGYRAHAVRLTRRVHRPQEFQRAVRLLIGRETLACLAVPALLGLALIAALDATGRLSAPGMAMIGAHVVLAGAYYSAFLLAGFEKFGWLCGAMLAALIVHVGAGAALGAAPLLGQSGAPLTDTVLYLGSVLALLALFLLGLAPIVGQVRHYR